MDSKKLNTKQKVYIFTGKESNLAKNNEDICWKIANSWEEGLKWTEIPGVAYVADDKEGNKLIKPIAKNPMHYNVSDLESSIKDKDIPHKNILGYYGYGIEYTDGYGHADYGSSGIAVQELLRYGTIKKSDDLIIVSDNNEKAACKIDPLYNAKYFVNDANKRNSAVEDILMKNDIHFKLLDIGTKRYKPSNESEIINSLVQRIKINQDKYFNYADSNLSLSSDLEFSKAMMYFDNTEDSNMKNKLVSFLNNYQNISTCTNDVQFNLLQFVYFLIDKNPSLVEDLIKNNENFNNIIKFLDSNCPLLTKEKPFNAWMRPSGYLKFKLESKKNILIPFMDQTFFTPIPVLRSRGGVLHDFKSQGVDIFDKKHYNDQVSFDLLANQIKDLIKNTDSCFFMPNNFNIRPEFKKINQFKTGIDLSTSTNDVIRTFWEHYTLNEALKQNKKVFGICGGHQVIANAMGFFVCRLSQKYLNEELKDQDTAHSPTLERKVPVYSYHTQGVPLNIEAVSSEDIKYYGEEAIIKAIQNNNKLLKDLKLNCGVSTYGNGAQVMKDLRSDMVGFLGNPTTSKQNNKRYMFGFRNAATSSKQNNERYMFSIQTHPEKIFYDERSDNIVSDFVHGDIIKLSPEVAKKIEENLKNIPATLKNNQRLTFDNKAKHKSFLERLSSIAIGKNNRSGYINLTDLTETIEEDSSSGHSRKDLLLRPHREEDSGSVSSMSY